MKLTETTRTVIRFFVGFVAGLVAGILFVFALESLLLTLDYRSSTYQIVLKAWWAFEPIVLAFAAGLVCALIKWPTLDSQYRIGHD